MATSLLKFSLKTNLVKSIISEIVSNFSKYYYAYGRSYKWGTNDTTVDPVSDAYEYEVATRNDLLFFKQIDANDISAIIPRINWTAGYTFDMYDEYSSAQTAFSGAAALETAEFYCVTDDYNVYKCIFNNNGQPSAVRPTGTDEKVIELADKYKWKYMYTIPLSLRNKFLSLSSMPVITALSNQFYSAGSIVSASIENPGKRYIITSYRITGFKVVEGGSGYASNAGIVVTVEQPDQSGGTAVIIDEITVLNGAITAVTVANNTTNSGYSYPPIVTVTGGDPTRAAVLEPIITRIGSNYTTLTVDGDGVLEENPYELDSIVIDDAGSGYTSVTFAFENPDLAGGIIAEATGVIADVQAATLSSATPTSFSVGGTPTDCTILAGAFNKRMIVGSVVKKGSTVCEVVALELDENDQYPVNITVDAVITVTSGDALYLTGCVVDYVITNSGYGYSKKFYSESQDAFASNLVLFDSTSISQRTGTGFAFSVVNKVNQAEIMPIINANGEIEAVRVVKPGIGYTYAIVTVNDSYTDLTRPIDFEYASILLNFGIGDVESRQSTVELTAKDGAIHAVRIINPGFGYDSPPEVTIVGNGSGATATAVLQDLASGSGIERIDITNEGSGYTEASIVLSGASPQQPAILSVPISPKGGHGRDAISELYSKSIMFHGQLSKEKNKSFTSTNDYRQVCIMKNPKIFGKNQNLRSSIGSTCFVAVGAKNQTNFSSIGVDMIMTYTDSVTSKVYEFRVIEKNDEYSTTESAILLSYLGNFIPPDAAVYNCDEADASFTSISTIDPDVNKFSGDMLTIDNRPRFYASNQQIIVATNSISF